MLLEARKQPRNPERFLIQVSAVHDPALADLAYGENLSSRGARITTKRFWEPGSQVDVKCLKFSARARVVYCQPINAEAFAVGLDFITQTGNWETQPLQTLRT
ncbi:MAG: hypothetical protein DMG40_17510 [Acidobacteria bacterium]|nr:MAG: hypothetical protein DMG40_17510 [Acidobacteriota bacterium]